MNKDSKVNAIVDAFVQNLYENYQTNNDVFEWLKYILELLEKGDVDEATKFCKSRMRFLGDKIKKFGGA